MKSIMSVNVDKFKQVQSLDFYNIIKDKIDGCEIFFNINNEEEVKYVKDLIFYFNRDNFYFQFHGDSELPMEKQKEYLNLINSFYRDYKINIVMHVLTRDTIEESINNTTVYIDELEEYIDENNLNITLSLENLNSVTYLKRLSKNYLYPILYNNDNLLFTYDIGHEIEEYGELTDLQEIEIERLNNIHIHTFKNVIDHLPIYEKDEHLTILAKSILYLKKINYDGTIVYEYDLYECNGDTIEEKILGYIDSMLFFKNYY